MPSNYIINTHTQKNNHKSQKIIHNIFSCTLSCIYVVFSVFVCVCVSNKLESIVIKMHCLYNYCCNTLF